MKEKWTERILTEYHEDAAKKLPNRSKEVEDEEERAHDEFFNSLSDEQKQKYVEYSLKEGGRATFETKVMYRRGFRSGAQLMLEILLGEE